VSLADFQLKLSMRPMHGGDEMSRYVACFLCLGSAPIVPVHGRAERIHCCRCGTS
jgi:hypothetical protein